MSRKRNQAGTKRLSLRVSTPMYAYLETITSQGLTGKTVHEVATSLIGRAILGLIVEKIIEQRKEP
jgi:hypothetical protein